MRVHVVTASRHGSTAGIGDAIAARLRERGLNAEAQDATEVKNLPLAGEPVVIGSPLYMGRWLKPAKALLDRLAAEPALRDVFVFSVGPLGDPPKPDDAKADDDVEEFILQRARGERLFSGRLERSRLGPVERIAVKAVKAPDGDYRDWEAIRAWADQISDEIRANSLTKETVGV